MDVFRVLLEFKRIQTYLFAVSKLRTILGANALIGESLRLELPRLAIQTGGCLGVEPPVGFPRVAGDPLSEPLAHITTASPVDNPAALYRQGILTRDGGHFQVLFRSSESAEHFCANAEALLQEKMEGLAYDIKVERWAPDRDDPTLPSCWKPLSRTALVGRATSDPLGPGADMPVCEWSGQGRATEQIWPEGSQVSHAVALQWHKGSDFRGGKTRDIIGLLQSAAPENHISALPCQDRTSWSQAQDLNELAGGKGRYLALIHVDGNGVGNRRPRSGERNIGNTPEVEFDRWLKGEAEVESFFYSMRATVRAALTESLKEVFWSLDPKTYRGIAPYQLLMVGGDDVLILMQANFALPWVAAYSKALAYRDLPDGKGPLTIGAGVAIAKSGYPFHALHRLAEDLASSSKRLARSGSYTQCSVVDWQVVSQSWSLDIESHRKKHDCISYSVGGRREKLVLSMKPYPVLPAEGQNESGLDDLQSLLRVAQKLRTQNNKVARSQRKALCDRLRTGLRSARLAVSDLPEEMLKLLQDEKACRGVDPWMDLGEHSGAKVYGSVLGDLAEIAEIPDLGKAPIRAGQLEGIAT